MNVLVDMPYRSVCVRYDAYDDISKHIPHFIISEK